MTTDLIPVWADACQLAAEMAGLGGRAPEIDRLARAACEQLARRLRPCVAPEDCRESLALAAAYTAVSHYQPDGGATPANVKIGEVSFSGGSAAELQKQREGLRQKAEAIMTPFVKSADFAFVGVDG